jgi:hypothetical protein
VVKHSAERALCGYREIQNPAQRCRIVDFAELARQCGFDDLKRFRRARREWVAETLRLDRSRRDACWSEAIAVGSPVFVTQIKREQNGDFRQKSTMPWRWILFTSMSCVDPTHDSTRNPLIGRRIGYPPSRNLLMRATPSSSRSSVLV